MSPLSDTTGSIKLFARHNYAGHASFLISNSQEALNTPEMSHRKLSARFS
jgi:hypothetical protein